MVTRVVSRLVAAPRAAQGLGGALLGLALGLLLAALPSLVTDRLVESGLLAPAPSHGVVMVIMPADAGSGAWRRAAGLLAEQGAIAVGLVSDQAPPPKPGLVTWRDPGSPILDSGMEPGGGAASRTWRASVEGRPMFPARLIEAAGLPVPGRATRAPSLAHGLPTLAYAQVAGLPARSLEGRIAVVGAVDPWATPAVSLPGGDVPLAEAAARMVAGPHLAAWSPLAAGLLGALMALLVTFLLTAVKGVGRRRLVLLSSPALAVIAPALLLPMGFLVPVEPLLGGVAGAALAWQGAVLLRARRRLGIILDAMVEAVGQDLGVADRSREPGWADLCRVALAWGPGEAAWAFQRTGEGMRPAASSGVTGSTRPGDLLRQLSRYGGAALAGAVEVGGDGGEAHLLVPARYKGRAVGLLVVRGGAFRPAAREALQVAADHLAAALVTGVLRERSRGGVDGRGLGAVLDQLDGAMERVLGQRGLLLGALQGSRTSHAIFDPLGRPVLVDQGFRAMLDRVGLSAESRLDEVWRGLQLPYDLLADGVAGGPPRRTTVPISGVGLDAWIHACRGRGRILGVAVELVDISELQAQDTVKSGLLEMVSYRVHNILAAIRGYADLLTLGEVEVQEVAPRISARCGEMAELFSRYEDVARDEGGAAEPVQLIQVLQEVVAGARRTLGEHRVILVETPVALSPVLADRAALARALMALILELARDLPDEEPVLVELATPGGAVEVKVRVEGHGPPLELLLQDARQHREQGVPLARRLVEEMGGAFKVEGGGPAGILYRLLLPEA